MFKIVNCTEFIPERRTREIVNANRLQIFNGSEDTIEVVNDSNYGLRFKLKKPCRIYANDINTIIDANEFWICNKDQKDEYIVLINSVTEAIVAQCILSNTYNKMIEVIANENEDTNLYHINLVDMEPLADTSKTAYDEYHDAGKYPKVKIDYDSENKTATVKAKIGFRSNRYVSIADFTSETDFVAMNKAMAFVDDIYFKQLEYLDYNATIIQSFGSDFLKVVSINDYSIEVSVLDQVYNLKYLTLIEGLRDGYYSIIPMHDKPIDIIIEDDNILYNGEKEIPMETITEFKSEAERLIDSGLEEIANSTITIDPNNIIVEEIVAKGNAIKDLSNEIKTLISKMDAIFEFTNIWFIYHKDQVKYIINFNTDLTDNLDETASTLEGFLDKE